MVNNTWFVLFIIKGILLHKLQMDRVLDMWMDESTLIVALDWSKFEVWDLKTGTKKHATKSLMSSHSV